MTHNISTSTEEEFLDASVAYMRDTMNAWLVDHNQCIIGLSGGSTPKAIYEALGREDIDWSKVFVFLIDERYIDVKDLRSNQYLVQSTLLKTANIPEQNLVFPDTSLPIDECNEKYKEDLIQLFDNYLPALVTLGIGEDGHIASLFPPVLELALGDQAFVVHTQTDRFDVRDRISVTLNVIASAQKQVFFLKGNGKKTVWEEMLASSEGDSRWPAKRILENEDATVISMW